MVWEDSTPGVNSIFFRGSTDGGATFEPPLAQPAKNLSAFLGECFADNPQLAASGMFIHVVWKQCTTQGTDIFYATSTDGGKSFSAPSKISSDNGSPSSIGAPQIAINETGVFILWTENNGKTLLLRRSFDGGTNFEPIQDVSSVLGLLNLLQNGQIRNSQLAVSGDHIYFAGRAAGPGQTQISLFLWHSTNAGETFEPVQRLSAPSGDLSDPDVKQWASDISLSVSGANVYIAWTAKNSGDFSSIFFRASSDNGLSGSWGPILDFSENNADFRDPKVASSGQNVYVAWYRVASQSIPIHGEIFYRHSINEGVDFSDVQNLSDNSGDSGSGQGFDLAVNEQAVHIFWMDDTGRSNRLSEVFHRYSLDGGKTFEPFQNVSNTIGASHSPQTGINSKGDVYLIWNDGPLVNRNILVGDVLFRRAVNDTPQPIISVVLIHGFNGSPDSFGEMRDLLEQEGLIVEEPFDYSSYTSFRSLITIEELASLFADHVRNILDDYPEGSQVDVVAHSMGGMIVRAWMAGMVFANLPYEGEIHRLVFLGTPNYGSSWAVFEKACKKQPCSQLEQLRFGSEFIITLHDRWIEFQNSDPYRISPDSLLFIPGTQSSGKLYECGGIANFGCTDGVVDISSAILPNTPPTRVRYVPYRHSGFVAPFRGTKIANVTDEQHSSYRLVSRFLTDGSVLDQCCGEDTIDYKPPHLLEVSLEHEGLLLVRLQDAISKEPITDARIKKLKKFNPPTTSVQYRNPNAGTITALGIIAPELYDMKVRVKGYQARMLVRQAKLVASFRVKVPNGRNPKTGFRKV